MRKIFADTGYWIALLHADDDLHQKARNLTISLKNVSIVTSEMVFTELLNAFSGKGRFYREKAVNFINHALNNPEIQVVSQTNEIFKSAVELYHSRPDQAWSHTDCTSFKIMEQQNILEALAYDKHFEQAGFVALLR